jgi:type II secretory pathway pseudopilin PulG
MIKTSNSKRHFSKSQGFTLVEAMLGAMIFVIGWAGVFSLVTTSFKTTKRSWDSYLAKQIAEYQYWELYYSIKHGELDLADTATYLADNTGYWGELHTADKEVCRVIVGNLDDQDLTASPPRVFIVAGDGQSGLSFYPAPTGITPGFGVCWRRFDPTEIAIGSAIASGERMNYQIINIEDVNNKANYNMEIEVMWPYPPESSPLPRSYFKQFSMGSVN